MTIPNPTREQLLAEIKAFTQADPGEIVLDAQARLGDIYTLAMNAGATETAESIAQVYSRVMELTNVNAKAVDLAVIASDMLQTVSDQLAAETQARTETKRELDLLHHDLESPWYAAQTSTVTAYVEQMQEEIEAGVMEYMWDSEQIEDSVITEIVSDGLPGLMPSEAAILYQFITGKIAFRQADDLRQQVEQLARHIAAVMVATNQVDFLTKKAYLAQQQDAAARATDDQEDAA